MGAHRGCSEHRSVYRQQRQEEARSQSTIDPTTTTTTTTTPASKTPSPYRYPESEYPVVMDEKRDYYGYRTSTPPPYPAMSARMTRRRGILPALAMAVLFAYSLWNYLRHPLSSSTSSSNTRIVPQEPPVEVAKSLVPLEAHIMSKCPDARDCLRDLVLPTMVKSLDKVNFTLSYIGTPTENDGVDCKHGPAECMGNIIELCAIHLYPDPKINLGFTMCLTREYSAIPDRTLVEDCALEHAIDIKALDDCATQDDGGFGVGMLRDSVRRSKDAGVTKSCTVRLNEEIYCIRDGGEWKDCPHGAGPNDLVIAIEKLYRSA
ncbi:hypothetical protein CLIM01_04688 [Colletotrichum limetticola]|uniref:Gamma interferon inducible lysosomal thiol reductase n=2 Tax=Colletotrichum acutatum species complex TaxID=2707335 RepID=A0ABQ9Q2H6_9PEZI|nr:hypothetical protein CLIM01_04688 [Colletotrichum limetticola]